MPSKIRRLEFDEVCDLFVSLGAQNSPAEMHGLLVGQLAAGKRMDYAEWLEVAREFIETQIPFTKDIEEQLQFIYMATLTALSDEDLGFYPLLPSDDADIEERLSSLGLWCQGFLTGFALVEKSITDLPESVNDAINDLAAIAHVGINENEEWDESADGDYFQIIEYVRFAAMNIFHDYELADVIKNEQALSIQTEAIQTGAKQTENKTEPYLTAQSLFKTRQLH